MDTLLGMRLDAYKETLVPVEEEFNHPRGSINTPWLSFDAWDAIGVVAKQYAEDRFCYPEGTPLPPFSEVASDLPLKILNKLNFDHLCKVYFSSPDSLDKSVCDFFRKESHEHHLVWKIESSMQCWGTGRSTWNDLVCAHNNIRQFKLGLDNPDFDVRLDHTIYTQECGWGQHGGTFLDGAFAYLVYYKKQHVMTIGFSVMTGKQILIQQIQLKNRRGNRFLFSFPQNRVEYVIDRFRESFPDHKLFLVNGESMVRKTLKIYQWGYGQACGRLDSHTKETDVIRAKSEDQVTEHDQWVLNHHLTLEKEKEFFPPRMEHLRARAQRIKDFYSNTGRYDLDTSDVVTLNALTHHKVIF